ncbi:MAG TPA: hypothetical protein VGN37_12995 [Actinocatenispora sp.]
MADTVLIVLPDRDDAEDLAEELRTAGYAPALVHRDMLAGDDDAEDVDWVIELTTAPDGGPASAAHEDLAALAETYDGFVSR